MEQTPPVPQIVITQPAKTKHNTVSRQQILDTVTKHKHEHNNQIKEIKKIIFQSTNLLNEQEEAILKQQEITTKHEKLIDGLNSEQIKLDMSILMLAETGTSLQEKLENNEKITQLLCKARGDIETEFIALKKITSNLETKISNNEEQISSLHRELILQNTLHEIEAQELKTTVEKQKQAMFNLTALILLWYYSKK